MINIIIIPRKDKFNIIFLVLEKDYRLYAYSNFTSVLIARIDILIGVSNWPGSQLRC